MLKFKIWQALSLLALLLLALVPVAGERSAASAGEKLLQFTSAGHVLGFGSHGVIIAARDHMLKMEFAGAEKTAPEVEESNPAGESISSPFIMVTYHNLWKGVTVVYEAVTGGIFRSSYYLEPEGNYLPVDRIRLKYNRPLSLDENGNLVIYYGTGRMVESAPVAWQEVAGERVPVAVVFTLKGDKEVGFSLGDYITGIPVTIDPTLVWNTFLGGSGTDLGYAIATDGTYVYVAGLSNATWGSPVRGYSGNYDAFAAKLDGSGNLIWNTFLGGNGNDEGYAIATDGTYVYVAGLSNATWGNPVHSYTGDVDAFVAKLDSSGNLLWNTFLGGDASDGGNAIATDGTYVYVAGTSFATWGNPVRGYQGDGNAFAAKLDSGGNLVWNTFLGSGEDSGNAIATDGTFVYIAGTSSGTWGSPVRGYSGGLDAFAAKLDSGGNLVWNTFLGGSSNDWGTAIATDGSYVYVAGFSYASWGNPVREYDADDDAFAAKLDGCGNLLWNTFLGGSQRDWGRAIATDGSYVYVAGFSYASWGNPVREYTAAGDAFVAKLDSSGNLLWNAFLGGDASDGGDAIATDGSYVYVAGYSTANWHGTNPPVRSHSGSGNYDAFIAAISEGQPLDVPRVTGTYTTSCSIKLYDWECNKYEPITGGTLCITYQMGHKIRGYWQPDVAISGWPQIVAVSGYVGSFHKEDGKVKNTPRLSLHFEVGDYCRYPASPRVTYILNGKIKWDKKLNCVKSIKGTIYGWGEWGEQQGDNSPKMGQFEGKFTAIPR